MACSGAGHVDILSRASGKTLAQFSAESSRLFLLTQPSIISVQGAPSRVTAYQQQHEDLTLHLQGGAILRYQHFFTVMNGVQSELVFHNAEHSLQQAVFSAVLPSDPQATVALKPAFVTRDNVEVLLVPTPTPATGSGNAVTTAGTEATGSMGSGEAAVGTTDEAGNTGDSSQTLQGNAAETLPGLTVNAISGDDAVNNREGIYGLEITGVSTHLPSGTQVVLTIEGKTWTGVIYDNSWSVQLSDTDLAAITDGNYTVTVSATDVNGNSTSASREVWLLTHPRTSNPAVTANDITTADAVYHDDVLYYTVSGTMVVIFPLTQVALKTDIMQTYYTATVGDNGRWSVDIPANELQNGFNTLTFGVLDVAGNWEEQQVSFPTTLSSADTSS